MRGLFMLLFWKVRTCIYGCNHRSRWEDGVAGRQDRVFFQRAVIFRNINRVYRKLCGGKHEVDHGVGYRDRRIEEYEDDCGVGYWDRCFLCIVLPSPPAVLGLQLLVTPTLDLCRAVFVHIASVVLCVYLMFHLYNLFDYVFLSSIFREILGHILFNIIN